MPAVQGKKSTISVTERREVLSGRNGRRGESCCFFSLTQSQCIVYPKKKRVRKGRRKDEQGSRKREGEEQRRKENVRAERRGAKGRVRH